MYHISGHSNPSTTDLSSSNGGIFHAWFLNYLKTPFFTADGCYVGGWWSHYKNNNHLDPSTRRMCYNSQIFTISDLFHHQ